MDGVEDEISVGCRCWKCCTLIGSRAETLQQAQGTAHAAEEPVRTARQDKVARKKFVLAKSVLHSRLDMLLCMLVFSVEFKDTSRRLSVVNANQTLARLENLRYRYSAGFFVDLGNPLSAAIFSIYNRHRCCPVPLNPSGKSKSLSVG